MQTPDFSVMSFCAWIEYRFGSGHIREHIEQTETAYMACEKFCGGDFDPPDPLKCWLFIVSELTSKINRPISPELVSRLDFERLGWSWWFYHFFSEDETVLQDLWQESARELRAKYGDTHEAWMLFVKEARDAEDIWIKHLQEKQRRMRGCGSAQAPA